jgi:hypothetical protein
LKKVHELVKNGATVLGSKPERTVSLVGYPQCDRDFKRLADEAWGPNAGQAGDRRFGKGRILWGITTREFFRRDGLAPDFEVSQATPQSSFDYIHRTLDGTDYYFVSSQNREPQKAELAFRVSGRRPELWDPMTGRTRDATAFIQKDGRTVLPLEFDPYGSVFVVFRKPIAAAEKGAGISNGSSAETFTEIIGPWDVRFDPKWGGPEHVRFDRLTSWIARPEEGLRFYSGKAVYRTQFDISAPRAGVVKLALDLGDVRDVGIARVTLNGRDLGIVWAPPFRVELADTLKAQGNVLEVEVANSWRNRLVGDRDLPEAKRFTRTNITIRKEWGLLDSGLLGPIRILAVR